MAAPTTKPQTAKHSILNPEKPKFGFGLEQVWPIDDGSSKAPSKHSVDIIAIPGLGATSEYTWKCRDPDNPDKKIDWLRDSNMLPGILPKARICIFKYDSQWFGVGAVDQRLDSVADKLLHTLEKFRGADNKTPIVFVAHCLGGIVLEQLLLTAQGQQHRFPSIFPRVAGCVFLGTPFRGTASQAKAMALARMAELAGMGLQSSLLKILERESPTLLELCDKFIALADDAKIRLFCFWELRQSDVASIFVKDPWFKKLDMFKQMELMVEPGSAKPSGARGTYLDSDHFQLNKYPGPKDDNFKSVSGELKDIAKQAPNILNSRRKLARKARVDDRVHGALINYFEEGFFDVRRTMKGSYEGSQSPESSWVVTGSVFQQWKEAEGPQLLWIHGEAGTGQRAIALSIRDDLSKPGEQRPIFASFFCDENDEFRRSFRGMLKILIRQIIDADPDMAEPLVPHVKIKTSNESAKENYDLDALDKIHVLWDALQAMGRTAPGGYIHLMVYGIEQLAPEPLRNLLQYMQDTLTHGGDAVETSPIKWILLSRSGHPEIKKSLGGHGHEIYLNDKANTKSVEDDLRAHISRRVKELGLTPSLGYFVKGYISSHAGGNRIYVDLAIQEIRNSQAERSLQQAEMRLLLGSFPYGLTNMFEHIRKRILSPTTEGIEYTREILRCLILQKRAPTMRELAIMADLPHQDRNNLRALKNYIIRCGAFVVLRGKDGDLNDDHMKVEWIDRLAQEHLEKCAKDELAMDSVEMQHGLIALRCLEYVYFHTEKYGAASSADQTSLDVDDMDSTGEAGDEQEKENEDLSDPSNEVSNFSQLPFATEDNDATPSIHFDVGSPDEEDAQMFDERDPLTYPMKCWLEHAKSARGAPINVIEEIDLSHEFWQVQSSLRQIWWDRIEWMGHFDHQDGVTALHVAAIAEVPELVEYLLQEGGKQGGCPDIHVEDSWGLQPLHVACYIGNYEIVQALLGAGADVNYVSTNDDDDGLWRDCPLHLAAGEGHVHILECLLDRGAEINMESERDGSVLYTACENGHIPAIKLLLDRGADVNLGGGEQKRAINVAAWYGFLEPVQLLVEHGAEIDPEEEYSYGSALGAASRRGHIDVAKLLLSKGWSASKTMEGYGSFLTCAATYGHLGFVQLLLDIESRTEVMEKALEAASRNGKPEVVNAILQKVPTLQHLKAFRLAAEYGRDDVLTLLFERGISKEDLDDALYISTDNERESTVKLLLTFGANPNAEGTKYGCALTASAYDGTTAIMQALIDADADVNKRGGEYGTPLQAAADCGKVENVQLLLDHGALVNTEPIGMYGYPLQAVCETGDVATVRLLLEKGANVNAYAENSVYGYAILAAVSEGHQDVADVLFEYDVDVTVKGGKDNKPVIVRAGTMFGKDHIEKILDKGADVNATCDRGTTALMTCAREQDRIGLEFLLSREADPTIVSERWGTALHVAAANGDEECCQLLLDSGADINVVGGPKGSPLAVAAEQDHCDVVKMLLKAGADAKGEARLDDKHVTPLQAACASGYMDSVVELFKHGAVIQPQTANGKYGYPLHAAARSDNFQAMGLLLAKGANPNLEGGIYGFPIIAAASAGEGLFIIEKLLARGASLHVRPERGLFGSVIAAAAYANDLEVLQFFVEKGANVHQTGGKYGSPLICAAIGETDMECVEFLLSHDSDIDYRSPGKYHTALIAAAYYNRVDYVTRLLELNADIAAHRNGRLPSAIAAAAIKGNKAVLQMLLEKEPPKELVNEALVEACAHRQSTSVDLLLSSEADVDFRHPILGTPMQALEAKQADGYNSDLDSDDGNDDTDDEDEDDEEDEDNEDEEEEEEKEDESEDDDASDDDSVDLSNEEEDDEAPETKIRKLLEKNMTRLKRGLTVKRGPSLRRGPSMKKNRLPPGLAAGQPTYTTARSTYEQYKPHTGTGTYPPQQIQQPYHPEPVQHRQSFQAYPGIAHANTERQPQNSLPPTTNATGTYQSPPVNAPSPSICQQQYRPVSNSPSRKPVPNSYPQVPQQQQPNSSMPQRQYSAGVQSEMVPSLPPRTGSQDNIGQRYGLQSPYAEPPLNPGSSGRHQQQQRQSSYTSPQPQYQTTQPTNTSPQPQYQQPPPPQGYTPPAQNIYGSPPHSSYSSPPQQSYTLPQDRTYASPPHPSYPSPPTSQQYANQTGHYQSPPAPQYQAYTSQPPSQGAGYVAYGQQQSQGSSQTSFQSSQYANSSSIGSSQQQMYATPNSSQGTGYNSQMPGQSQKQGQRWATGGYEGEGYG